MRSNTFNTKAAHRAALVLVVYSAIQEGRYVIVWYGSVW